MNQNMARIVLTSILLATCAPSAARAAIILVDARAVGTGDGSSWANAFTRVQSALNTALSGDQVWVAAGRYVENIKLKNGVALYGGFAGNEIVGAFDLNRRQIQVNETTLDGNQVNSVVRVPATVGPATRLDGFTITNGKGKTIHYRDGYGGGILIDGGSATVIYNRVMGNHADQGGGIYVTGGTAIIANNLIVANGAEVGGGLKVSGAAIIVNNTIVANEGSYGAGLNYGSAAVVSNNIVAFNASGIRVYGSTALLRNNCVYGNLAYDYYGEHPGTTNGNLSVDPQLADVRYGNAHLQPGSPCIDAGDETVVIGQLDIDGQERTQPAGGNVDIGADEADGILHAMGPYVAAHVSAEGDDANDGSSWALAKRTIQAGVELAARRGGDVWVKGGRYPECIIVRPHVFLYGGFAGSESSPNERPGSVESVIDAGQQGSTIAIVAGYGVAGVDGFTITGGSATDGGGIYIYRAGPVVRGNIIKGNSATWNGGGISAETSSALITENSLLSNSGAYGGGATVVSNSHATVCRNLIMHNAAERGGGLAIIGTGPNPSAESGWAVVDANVVSSNFATAGGGIEAGWTWGTISNNLFIGNESQVVAGGVLLGHNAPLLLTNCTIVGNRAPFGGGMAWTMDRIEVAHITVTNSVIAYNSSGVSLFAEGTEPGSAEFNHNCVFANVDGNYDERVGDRTGTRGNISADPRFVVTPQPGSDGLWATPDDFAGNLHLRGKSPCVDAGTNAYAASEADFDDLPRIVDGNTDGIAIIDMGAYEYDEPTIAGDLDGDDAVDLDDYVVLMAAFGRCASLADFFEPADLDGDGCITFVDYQAWLMAYRAFIGDPLAAPPALRGDLNGDLRVDAADAAAFAACLTGPSAPTAPNCRMADMGGDGDVDLADFARLQVWCSSPN